MQLEFPERGAATLLLPGSQRGEGEPPETIPIPNPITIANPNQWQGAGRLTRKHLAVQINGSAEAGPGPSSASEVMKS